MPRVLKVLGGGTKRAKQGCRLGPNYEKFINQESQYA